MQPNHIKVYNNVIEPKLSQQLIAMFEESPQHHEEIVLEGHRSFKQVTLQNHPEWEPFVKPLQNTFYTYIDK